MNATQMLLDLLKKVNATPLLPLFIMGSISGPKSKIGEYHTNAAWPFKKSFACQANTKYF